MENINCTHNWVLIKFDNSNEYIKVGNERIYIDTSFEAERRAQVKGVVIKTCPKLFFRHEEATSTSFNVPVEIQPGDEVLFHFNAVKISVTQGRVWKDGTDNLMFIPYDQLFAAIRNGQIIPLNGYLFIEPIKEGLKSSTIFIPEQVSKKRGVVKYIGAKVSDYLFYPDMSDEMIDVNIGDEIAFAEIDAIPLHDSYEAELKGMYRMHRMDIQAIITYEE